MLDKATTYLDTYYTERYQEAYRESYDDDSLEVTVRHQYLTTAEYDALKHFQWKDAIHQIITIKKDGEIGKSGSINISFRETAIP